MTTGQNWSTWWTSLENKIKCMVSEYMKITGDPDITDKFLLYVPIQ